MRHRSRYLPVSRWSSTPKHFPDADITYIETGDNRIRSSVQPSSHQQFDPPPVVEPSNPGQIQSLSTPLPALSPEAAETIQEYFPALAAARAYLAEEKLGSPLPSEQTFAQSPAAKACEAPNETSTTDFQPARQQKRAMPRPQRKSRSRRRKSSDSVEPDRHERLCAICGHPDRDAIEEGFLHWRSPQILRSEFDLPSRTSIYRHAHALGLFQKRSGKCRSALEHIIEEAERVKPTAEGVIQAIRAYTHLSRDGEWIDPPTSVIVSSGRHSDLSPSLPHPASATISQIQRPPVGSLVSRFVRNLIGTRANRK